MAKSRTKPKGVEEEKPSLLARFKFSDTPQEFEIDVLDLTTEEEVMVEEFFNKPWEVLMAQGWITASVKGRVFAAYLARRRVDPNFTYKDALSFEPHTVEDDGGDEETKRPTKGSRSGGSRS